MRRTLKPLAMVSVFLFASLNIFSGMAQANPGVGKAFWDCMQCPEMVVVPSGSFEMGKPAHELAWINDGRPIAPVHQVTIPAPFAVGRHEVTFDEWDACVSAGGCDGYRPDDQGWGRGHRPVINVSWEDAQAYARWLSDKTGHPYRLLSESEWEYVTRAGTQTAFHVGDRITTDQANFNGSYSYNGSPQGIFQKETLRVGSFPPNDFGIHDVHGNVSEWVEDCFNNNYTGAPWDNTARMTGDCGGHVLRGGSWASTPWFLRSSNRVRNTTTSRSHNNGFRIARTLT